MPRAALLVSVAVVLGWLALVLPLATGERTLLLRDVFVTHLPYKAFGAAALAQGEIPAVLPEWAAGQPFRGNPNALPFYPGNLLYLVAPLWSALNLHFVLHWALAALGMGRLARAYGLGFEAALVAALAYAGSGYMLSALTFYNLVTVAAWAPWVLAGIARGGARGVATGGLACGLMLLGGEPITASIFVPAMAVVALERHGARRGLLVALAIGGSGLLLAAPQLAATARLLGETWRATHGLDLHQVAANDLHPFRLLELILPLPWGWPSNWDRFSFWAPRVTPQLPYFFSVHFGIVALGLALAAARRRLPWAALGVGGLGAAWALGLSPDVTYRLTFGLFRYPQKFLLLPALAGAILAAFGLERVLAGQARARRWLVAAAALGAIAIGLALGSRAFADLLRERLVAGKVALVAATQAAHWIVLFAVAALLLAAAAWAVARRSGAGLVAVQALALLQLAPAWVTDRTETYREPSPWARIVAAAPERGVLAVPAAFPYWEERQPYDVEARNPISQARIARLDLEPPFAVLFGLSAPVAPDLEGLSASRMVYLQRRLAEATWDQRLPWLRRLGVGWITRNVPGDLPGAEVVESVDRLGAPTTLYRLADVEPLLRWPRRLALAKDSDAAFEAVASGRIGADAAIVERPIDQRPGAELRLISDRPDEIRFEVAGAGGLVVVRRAFWSFYRASLADGTRLATEPVDLALLGVEVPPGRHEVAIRIPPGPERPAAGLALVMAAILAALAWRGSEGRLRRPLVAFLAPLALLVAVAVAPLATGARTLVLRDVFNTHLALRATLADGLRAGTLPLIDPARAGGQPLAGNPNAVPFYPDNLLLLVASDLWQLNAHFWLHWIVALAAAHWLGRAWGLGREGAICVGAAYAFSGFFLSQLNLYNAVAPVALAPALAAAMLETEAPATRRRGLLLTGVLLGLLLVGGDPILALLALAAALALALSRHGRKLPWPAVAWRSAAASCWRCRSSSSWRASCPSPTAATGATARPHRAAPRPIRAAPSTCCCRSSLAGPIGAWSGAPRTSAVSRPSTSRSRPAGSFWCSRRAESRASGARWSRSAWSWPGSPAPSRVGRPGEACSRRCRREGSCAFRSSSRSSRRSAAACSRGSGSSGPWPVASGVG